jgi:hypothetical protein
MADKVTTSDWAGAHKQGVADLTKGFEAERTSRGERVTDSTRRKDRQRAERTQESITNEARADYERQ